MLRKEESLLPRMYANIRRGILPLLDEDTYGVFQVPSLPPSLPPSLTPSPPISAPTLPDFYLVYL
jgi:hypothetical protein